MEFLVWLLRNAEAVTLVVLVEDIHVTCVICKDDGIEDNNKARLQKANQLGGGRLHHVKYDILEFIVP